MKISDIEFTIRYTKGSNLRLTVNSQGKLVLYCPKRCPKSQYTEFVEKNAKKLLSQHSKRRKDNLSELFCVSDGVASLPYLGVRYPIRFDICEKAHFNNSEFIFPHGTDENTILNTYKEFLRSQSKVLLPILCEGIAASNALSYNKITVKDAGSRWGSCSSAKNLNFSLALLACPYDFVRYVVAHELTHTLHLNHSSDFYTRLEEVSPIPLIEAKSLSRAYSYVIRAICRK